jgi:hypothetical protein
MDLGIPCNLTTVSRISWATCGAVNGCLRGIKWANFENLSTTTKIELKPSDLGRPMKSMVISCHVPWGTGNGCKRLAGCILSAFAYWQIEHYFTKVSTWLFIPLQWKSFLRLTYVACTLEWSPNALEWKVVMTLVLSAELSPIQIWDPLLIKPWFREKTLLIWTGYN